MWSLGMILHKMLFFYLPYRYAAEGDANGQPISSTDDPTKMEKLEKEVLSYPGFKSIPEMVTQFETRRLPRSFLILLESLLNIVPSNRPSVERISAAIKDHKVGLRPVETSCGTNIPVIIVQPSRSLSTPETRLRCLVISYARCEAAVSTVLSFGRPRGDDIRDENHGRVFDSYTSAGENRAGT